jgi:heme oxygenase
LPETEGLPSSAHPLGVAYVVAGSALGTEVLRRHWQEGSDERARLAHRFLGDQRMRGYWQETLAALWAAEPSPEEAQVIVDGAEEAFTVYQRSFAAMTG